MKARLLKDVCSFRHETREVIDGKKKLPVKVTGPKIYGRRGEEVVIVSDHDNVLIVKNAAGDAYPVKIEDIVIINQ